MASPFSLGVVIPCHKPYIPYLRECLDSIEAQTRKPSSVVVVCSSAKDEDIPESYTKYSFPLRFITREDERNQAQNRNQGASVIGTDFISFFDADDIMHPQRIASIAEVMPQVDIVLHSFTMDAPTFSLIYKTKVYMNELMRSPTGCAVFKPDWNAFIHHSQVTVRATMLEKVKFHEEPELKRREDSLFCGELLAMESVRNAYIADVLSWYRLNH